MQEIICHIGFPKTGTTYLQKQVFPKINGINYIGWKRIKELLYAIIEKDDSYYDNDKIKTDLLQHGSSLDMLLSYEALTGHHIKTQFPNRTQIARRLKAIGVTKIIITIRNQVDVLESTYKQYIKSGGVIKLASFFDLYNNSSPHFYKNYFDYEKIIDLYVEIFGIENVLVLQYEDIFTNKATFNRKLSNFLKLKLLDIENVPELKVNKSLSNFSTKLLRIINHFTYNSHRPSSLVSKKLSTSFFYRLLSKVDIGKTKNKLIAQYEHEIHAHFLASNHSINEKYKLQLHEKYGILTNPPAPQLELQG